jgi:hypothetical protein
MRWLFIILFLTGCATGPAEPVKMYDFIGGQFIEISK